MKPIIYTIIFVLTFNSVNAQEKLLDSLISKNYSTFEKYKTNSFDGQGWKELLTEMEKHNSILLGESHFTNEIPYFTNALIDNIKFDNYFLEVDPFSTKIIATKIQSLNEKQLTDFNKNYSSNYSFLELEPEFNLFKKIVQKKINTYGIEQISLDADRLIISQLFEISKNEQAKSIYEEMLANSLLLEKEDAEKYYMFSKDFSKKIDELLSLKISDNEKEQLKALKLSDSIYSNGNHHLRVQLMKNLLLKSLEKWSGQKNLFKFGAVHLPKGESLLEIYDIGNLINNIEDANFRSSLHLMLVGKYENEEIEDMYKSFLKVIKDDKWYCFDLRPLKQSISDKILKVDDIMLSRIFKGYDFLIFIPKLTESKNL